MIDWQRIDDLACEIGPDAVAEVVALFLEETDAVIARLATAAPTCADYHFLKGAALNLGLTQLAALCHEGEQDAKAGTSASHALAAMLAEYFRSRAALLAGLAGRFFGDPSLGSDRSTDRPAQG